MKTAILILTLASSLFGQFTSTNAKRIQGKNVGSLSLCADGDALTWVSANARFECVAGAGGAPTNAQFLTLTTNATLSAERVLTMDANMTATDGGAGGAYTIGPDTAKIQSRAGHQSGATLRCASSTGSDTYTCTMTPTLTAYTDGMVIEFEATVTANTGAASLNVDTLGAINIKLCDGSTDPANGDIAIGKQVALRYDGTVFRLPCNPATVSAGESSCMATAGQGFFWPWGTPYNDPAAQNVNTASMYYQFTVPCTMTVGRVGIYIHTASGTCGGTCGLTIGLLNSSLTRLTKVTMSSGGTPDINTSDLRTSAAFDAAQTLTPGTYYLHVYSDSTALRLGTAFGTWNYHLQMNVNSAVRIGVGDAATGSGATLSTPASSAALTAPSGTPQNAQAVPLSIVLLP